MNDDLYIQIQPQDINYVNRIMEGYEYLGMVTTLDRRSGILRIRCTSDTKPEAASVLENLSISLRFLSNTTIAALGKEV